MIQHKIIDGKIVALTPQEITDRQNAEAAWLASQPSPLEVAMETLRAKRNKALTDSDWTVLNDVPLNPAMRSAWMNYRTLLRNITDNLTNVEDVKAVTLPIPPK
jgi:hypothetical protein